MSVKIEKIEQNILREISEILRRHASDKFLQEITVTGLDVSNDLSHAKVYYTVLNIKDLEHVEKALTHATGFIRSELAHTLELRKVPELHFMYDNSIEYGEKIEKVIKDINSDKNIA